LKLAIIGLSSKSSNIPRLVLENLIRWGYKGRIFGVNPKLADIVLVTGPVTMKMKKRVLNILEQVPEHIRIQARWQEYVKVNQD
jgi:predicted CoA-binding protein